MSDTQKKSFIRKYIFSTDHKVIAVQYLIVGLIFLAIGGMMAFIMRMQIANPWQPIPVIGNLIFPETGGVVMPEVYNQLFTLHGGIMVFFAITPILLGALGNFSIPLDIGAKDMVFPRVNMLSFWFLVLGSICIIASFFVPGGTASGGWTLYTPLTSSLKASPGWGIDLFILGLALDAVSILMGGINYLTTFIKLRAKGMKLMQTPLTTWGLVFSSILNTIWLPLIAAALFMVLGDRRLDTGFFVSGPLAPHDGGQVLLFQHLFWGFGHPEVYIVILPVWGLVGDLISNFSRKPAFGYKATVISMLTISALSGIVWGHHMFTSGMNPLVGKVFMFLTITVSVPTAIFFFNWLATMWRGSIRLTVPMLYCLGVVFVFAIGGLTGLYNAVQTLDVYIHDTYVVVGHFHYTLAASVLFGLFAFVYYWFPKMFGRKMNDWLGVLHFWTTFIFLNAVFFTMMYVGFQGHMRRIADPTAYEFLKPVLHLNTFMAKMTTLLVLSQFLFLFNFIFSLFFGKKAGSNPWEAAGLAWVATESPPVEHNFTGDPVAFCGPHEYGLSASEDKDYLPQNDPASQKVLLEKHPSKANTDEEMKGISWSSWISSTKLGMWVFLISEIMLFTGLVGSYIVLRLGAGSWPDPTQILNTTLLGVNTVVLLCSSLSLALAVDAIHRKTYAQVQKYLLITAGFGLLFLIIKGYDYHHMWTHGFTITSDLFGNCYYLLTGFHALHVLSGVILLLYLWVASKKDSFCEVHGPRIESSGLYWHFIDIVWVILFAILVLV